MRRASCFTARQACRWHRYAFFGRFAWRGVRCPAHRGAFFLALGAMRLTGLLPHLIKPLSRRKEEFPCRTLKICLVSSALVQKMRQYGAEARKAYKEVRRRKRQADGFRAKALPKQSPPSVLFGCCARPGAKTRRSGGQHGRQAAQLHKEWLCFTWPHYSAGRAQGPCPPSMCAGTSFNRAYYGQRCRRRRCTVPVQRRR